MDLQTMQANIAEWRQRNFPDSNYVEQALGLCEEAGEIAHAVLKHKQGIRDIDTDTARALIADGIGDMVIYAMNLASLCGINFETAIKETYEKVMQRDWVSNPTDADKLATIPSPGSTDS